MVNGVLRWDKSLIGNGKKILKSSCTSEGQFREVIHFFAADLPALTAAELTGLNYRTLHRIYTLMREYLVEMALQEVQPFAGDIEVDESCFGIRRVRGKRCREKSVYTPLDFNSWMVAL